MRWTEIPEYSDELIELENKHLLLYDKISDVVLIGYVFSDKEDATLFYFGQREVMNTDVIPTHYVEITNLPECTI